MQELVCAVCFALQTAINAGEVDRGTSYFAPDAVVIQPRIGGMPQVYVGRDQIRWWLAAMTTQHARLQPLTDPELTGLGFDRVRLETDVVLTQDALIESLTTVLTPDAARDLAGSLD